MPRLIIHFAILTLLLLVNPVLAEEGGGKSAAAGKSWQKNWALEPHFKMEIDSDGYTFPTAMAFVPNPGSGPKDPLYFVTELVGNIKVVTNDRTVYSFAENLTGLKFKDGKIAGDGDLEGEFEFGLAGICLEPVNGYVFVTFGYYTKDQIGRNNVVRFKTTPDTFSIKPESSVAFSDVFLPYETGPSHQIGPCQVHNDQVYISIGDGFKSPLGSQSKDNLQGKIVRMTLDGKPVADNPFYDLEDSNPAGDYIWTYGLRNPFSQKIVNGDVYIADNGLAVDRFLRLEKGTNYLWDGTDVSIATNAQFTFSPSVGPVQMDYVTPDNQSFPEYFRGSFFISLSGSMGGKIIKHPGIYMIRYDMESGRIIEPPKYFVKYLGKERQKVVGLAIGPDAMYFIPIFDLSKEGRAAVVKLSYDQTYEHPVSILHNTNPLSFMREKGCLGCHKIREIFEQGGAKGPPLDRGEGDMIPAIKAKLAKEVYSEVVKKVDELDEELYKKYKDIRHQILNATGQKKLKLWVKYHILEPKFDNPQTQMPNMSLTESEADLVTNYLFSKAKNVERGFMGKIKSKLPKPKYWHMLVLAVAGFFAGIVLMLLFRRLGT